MTTIFISIVVFTAVILLLVSFLSIAKKYLVAGDTVKIVVNGNESSALEADTGFTLLRALANHKLFVPSACGGQGLCGTCRVRVNSGGGVITPIERNHISEAEAHHHNMRLACQVKLKHDIAIELPEQFLSSRQWRCVVRSNHNVSTFIKELVLEMPRDEQLPFRAGGYVLLECGPHQLKYSDFDIDPEFHDRWDQLNMWQYTSIVRESTRRSYSLANYPLEADIIVLNVRIASPPPNHPEFHPGKVSSFIFNLKVGDKVNVVGPFGDFFARDTNAEMILIGGGAGMAPMRSLVYDQLKRLHSSRKISFWYGARSLREAFYVEEFNQLAAVHNNFDWTLALSVEVPEDNWTGPRGFIHEVVYEKYLCDHLDPEDAEYYLCGPPQMIEACTNMLVELGVPDDNILFDKFG